MLNPTRGALRALRLSSLVFLCGSVTVVGHAAGGGESSALGLVLVLVLMTVGAVFVTGRQTSLAMLFGFAAGSQIVAHTLLGLVAGAQLSAHANPTFANHHGAVITPSGSAAELHQHATMSPTMLMSHLLACVAIAVILRTGERVAFGFAQVVREVVLLVTGASALPRLSQIVIHQPKPLRLARAELRPTAVYLQNAIERRGPPALTSY